MECEKAGCSAVATIHVTLDAADGSMSWWACRDCAMAFKYWVITETNRQAQHWASVELVGSDAILGVGGDQLS